jgi:hypothetical protein
MGFLGLHSSVGHPWRLQYHRRKETSVARRVHRSKTLEVHITFEPSRVSPACVAQAYEQVVPRIRRTTLQGLSTQQAECTPQTQRVGRRSVS